MNRNHQDVVDLLRIYWPHTFVARPSGGGTYLVVDSVEEDLRPELAGLLADKGYHNIPGYEPSELWVITVCVN